MLGLLVLFVRSAPSAAVEAAAAVVAEEVEEQRHHHWNLHHHCDRQRQRRQRHCGNDTLTVLTRMVARIGCRPGYELPAGVVDLVGNLLNDQAGNMTHDGLNQYTYDADPAGNVLNDGVNAYLYDIEGGLCAVENLTVGTITQYVYDAEGTRVAKGKLSWTGSGNPTWNTACSGITGQGGWTSG